MFNGSPVVINDGRIFLSKNVYPVSGKPQTRSGELHIIAGENGYRSWSFEFDHYLSVPTVVDEVVYVGSKDNSQYAVDASDGTRFWEFETGDNTNYNPLVVNGVVYFGSNDHHVYGVEAVSGDEIWAYKTGGPVQKPLTMTRENIIAVDSAGGLFALDAETGRCEWDLDNALRVTSSTTYSNGLVFVGVSSDSNYFYALDAEDGSVKWQIEIDSIPSSNTLTLSEDSVFFATKDNVLYCIDPSDGSKKWVFEAEKRLYGRPVVINDVLYIPDWNELCAIDGKDGTKLWGFEVPDKMASSPVICNGTIYLVSAKRSGRGSLLALN